MCVERHLAIILQMVVLCNSLANHEPREGTIVWKNLYAKTPSVNRPQESKAASFDVEDIPQKPAAIPKENITYNPDEEFSPAGQAAPPPKKKKDKDQQLKQLAEWDFLPTVGNDKSNKQYYAADDDGEVDPKSMPTPDSETGKIANTNRNAMAFCKAIQFDQVKNADDCIMCQNIVKSMRSKTIVCRCYKSALDMTNHQRCVDMRAKLKLKEAKIQQMEQDADRASMNFQVCWHFEFCDFTPTTQ